MKRFSAVTAPTLALSMTDDVLGTVPAIERLLGYFTNSPATHVRIAPGSIGQASIGHLAFVSDRSEGSLWPIALERPRHGRCPVGGPGTVLSSGARGGAMPGG
jgi:predicted alpha/beta hydrolase